MKTYILVDKTVYVPLFRQALGPGHTGSFSQLFIHTNLIYYAFLKETTKKYIQPFQTPRAFCSVFDCHARYTLKLLLGWKRLKKIPVWPGPYS